MTEISWQHFPRWGYPPPSALAIIDAFNAHLPEIQSPGNTLASNEVLAIVRPDLEARGFQVERGKSRVDTLSVPVLYGPNGRIEKAFEADAVYRDPPTGNLTVLEVEAGRAYTNYQFLKDLFEACMMQDVDYLTIAVRRVYRESPDFDKVVTFFDTLYASQRLALPLDGVLVLGY